MGSVEGVRALRLAGDARLLLVFLEEVTAVQCERALPAGMLERVSGEYIRLRLCAGSKSFCVADNFKAGLNMRTCRVHLSWGDGTPKEGGGAGRARKRVCEECKGAEAGPFPVAAPADAVLFPVAAPVAAIPFPDPVAAPAAAGPFPVPVPVTAPAAAAPAAGEVALVSLDELLLDFGGGGSASEEPTGVSGLTVLEAPLAATPAPVPARPPLEDQKPPPDLGSLETWAPQPASPVVSVESAGSDTGAGSSSSHSPARELEGEEGVAYVAAQLEVTQRLFAHGETLKAGGSSQWTVVSDARLKDVVATFELGHGELKQLRPKVFTYKGDPLRRHYVGLIAQEVPETLARYCRRRAMVRLGGAAAPPTLIYMLDHSCLQFVAINAINQAPVSPFLPCPSHLYRTKARRYSSPRVSAAGRLRRRRVCGCGARDPRQATSSGGETPRPRGGGGGGEGGGEGGGWREHGAGACEAAGTAIARGYERATGLAAAGAARIDPGLCALCDLFDGPP